MSLLDWIDRLDRLDARVCARGGEERNGWKNHEIASSREMALRNGKMRALNYSSTGE